MEPSFSEAYIKALLLQAILLPHFHMCHTPFSSTEVCYSYSYQQLIM